MTKQTHSVWCDICSFVWQADKWQGRTGSSKDCARCQAIQAKYPELFDWVVAVAKSHVEEHAGRYKHEYSSYDD